MKWLEVPRILTFMFKKMQTIIKLFLTEILNVEVKNVNDVCMFNSFSFSFISLCPTHRGVGGSDLWGNVNVSYVFSGTQHVQIPTFHQCKVQNTILGLTFSERGFANHFSYLLRVIFINISGISVHEPPQRVHKPQRVHEPQRVLWTPKGV